MNKNSNVITADFGFKPDQYARSHMKAVIENFFEARQEEGLPVSVSIDTILLAVWDALPETDLIDSRQAFLLSLKHFAKTKLNAELLADPVPDPHGIEEEVSQNLLDAMSNFLKEHGPKS